jgi:hypothetical protein
MAEAAESSHERIERLVREGKMPRAAVEEAERLWREQLSGGVRLPNGETAVVTLGDLYHLIVDFRVWRKPWRIERALVGVFELRTAEQGRRVGLNQWDEDGRLQGGVVVLDPDMRVRSLHLVDDRRMRKFQRRGDLLWKR